MSEYAERPYRIIIENAGGVQSNKSPIANDGSPSDSEKGKGLLTKSQARAFMTGITAYRQVKGYANQIISFEHSMVALRTGSNEMQERAQFAQKVFNDGLGILESGVVAGLATGNVVGFVVGVGVGLVSKGINIMQNQIRINTERSVENQSIQLNYIRAGARGSRQL